MLLCTVLQQAGLKSRCCNLLINLDRLIVILQRCCILSNLEHALVGGTVGLFPLEIVRCLLVMLHGLVQVSTLGLKDSCNCLMMFCCNSEPPHVRVNVNCLLETGCSFLVVVLLVAVGCVHVVGCGVVLVSKLDMVVGNGAECISCSAPLLRHLVHVRRPPIALQCLVLLARTSE